jgi:hypothetical protein
MEQVDARRGSVGAVVGKEVKSEGVALDSDTVAGIVDAFKRAVSPTSLDRRAIFGVKVARDTGIVTTDVVQPTVVGIEDDRGVHRLATGACACLSREERVNLRRVSTWLLTQGKRG